MISIVIPLYNKEESIRSTINSVLVQAHQDFELIIVDDGSTDKGCDIVESFTDERIILIRKENGGVSSARNEGIRQARGNYVAFLDADDLWDKSFLLEISRLIEAFPDAGILGTSYGYLKDGDFIKAGKPLPEGFFGIVDNTGWDKGHIYCSSAVCCRRDALLEAGAFDEDIAYGEDTDLWWRIMFRYPAAFSNKALATYRFDEDNRAMNKVIPLDKLYINQFEKYNAMRHNSEAFRHFIDQECMWWLFPYFLNRKDRKRAKAILSQIDLDEYKPSFKFRFRFPYIYNIYRKIRG